MPNARPEETDASNWGARPRNARDAIAQAVQQIDKTAVAFQDARRAIDKRQQGAAIFCLDRLARQVEQIRDALAVADSILTAESKAAPF